MKIQIKKTTEELSQYASSMLENATKEKQKFSQKFEENSLQAVSWSHTLYDTLAKESLAKMTQECLKYNVSVEEFVDILLSEIVNQTQFMGSGSIDKELDLALLQNKSKLLNWIASFE